MLAATDAVGIRPVARLTTAAAASAALDDVLLREKETAHAARQHGARADARHDA